MLLAMMKHTLSALLVLVAASTVSAQDFKTTGILKSVALDPTTYAPALIYRAAMKADWKSSQPLFTHGYVELNKHFTVSGHARTAPLSYADGNAKINRMAMRLVLDSAVHNTASQTLERILLRAHPEHKKLIKVLGVVERAAVASYLTYSYSGRHFRQARANAQLLAAAGGR